jgi:hypothetical protein
VSAPVLYMSMSLDAIEARLRPAWVSSREVLAQRNRNWRHCNKIGECRERESNPYALTSTAP